ncbi:hypothetical protein GAMM_200003 [Gammaproteobacteria bacterium]
MFLAAMLLRKIKTPSNILIMKKGILICKDMINKTSLPVIQIPVINFTGIC